MNPIYTDEFKKGLLSRAFRGSVFPGMAIFYTVSAELARFLLPLLPNPGVSADSENENRNEAREPIMQKGPLRMQAKPIPEEQYDIAQLAEVVKGLIQQVRQLALILDEVREELIWAVRNDRFNCAGASKQYGRSSADRARPRTGKCAILGMGADCGGRPRERSPVCRTGDSCIKGKWS